MLALSISPPGNDDLYSDSHGDSTSCETNETEPVFPPRILAADLIHTEDALIAVS